MWDYTKNYVTFLQSREISIELLILTGSLNNESKLKTLKEYDAWNLDRILRFELHVNHLCDKPTNNIFLMKI